MDLQKGTLTAGQKLGRAPLLVALRVVLTFLIEGAVLFLFGYRQKRSWLVFLVEIIAFCFLLKERGKGWAAFYAITVNDASLFLGGLLIYSLPV